MKNFTQQVFVTLGVIFMILLVVITIFLVMDPYGIKPLIFGGSASMEQSNVSSNASTDTEATSSTDETSTSSEPVAGGFELSSAQIEAMVNLGIDPATVSSSISPEQEECFIDALGEVRVEEIKAGAVPSAFEFLKAKSCV